MKEMEPKLFPSRDMPLSLSEGRTMKIRVASRGAADNNDIAFNRLKLEPQKSVKFFETATHCECATPADTNVASVVPPFAQPPTWATIGSIVYK
jgi:hypothetical protein